MLYDLIALCILGFTTLRGAAKGVAWQLAGLAAVILCFVFATPLSLAVSPSIKLEPPLNRWVAMLVIYLIFSFFTFTLARSVRSWLEKERFADFDRHLGALLGMVKGAAIVVVMTFFIVAMAHSTHDYILHTRSGFAAAYIMDRLDPVMPEELHALLGPYIHELDQPGTEVGTLGEPGEWNAPSQDPFGTGGSDSATGSGTTFEKIDHMLAELVREIPGMVDRALHKLVAEALQNTIPEDRAELVEQIKSAPPDQVQHIAKAWRKGRPIDRIVESEDSLQSDQPPHQARDRSADEFADRSADKFADRRADKMPTASPEELIEEISQILAQRPADQERKYEEIELALDGIPNRVVTATLLDWKADLLASNPDPDRETNARTPLDVRIVRQLERARYPMTRLSSDLQDRLEAVPRR